MKRNIRVLLTKYIALIRPIFYKKRFFNLIKVLLSYIFHTTKITGLPFLVAIEPTNRCNLGCILCITGCGKLKRAKGNIPLGSFKEIGDQLEEGMLYLVMYNMGESLLNPDIYDMIRYMKHKNVFVRLSTSGDINSKDNLKRLIDSGVDEVIISLDYADSPAYKKYKKSDGFERVINNVKFIIKERRGRPKPFITLQLLVAKDTENDICRFKKMAYNLGVDKALIKTLRINFPGSAPKTEYLPKNKRYIRSAYRNRIKRSRLCYRPWISTLILWDGSVVPCCFDMEGDYTFGDTKTADFKKIWNNRKYTAFRRQMIERPQNISLCNECSLKDIFHDISLLR